MAKEPDKLREIADNAILLLASRISGPLICSLCIWILASVSNLKEEMAAATATIAGISTRVSVLEEWRNDMDAFGKDNNK